jgi:hypothetical protein
MPRSAVPPETLLLLVLLLVPPPSHALRCLSSAFATRISASTDGVAGCLNRTDSWLPQPTHHRDNQKRSLYSHPLKHHHGFLSEGIARVFPVAPENTIPVNRKTRQEHETRPTYLEANRHHQAGCPSRLPISRKPVLPPRQSACSPRRRCLGPGSHQPSPSRRPSGPQPEAR